MKKYDLHIHTHYSNCSVLKPMQILKIARKLRLDGIAITDHDTFKGAKEVSKLSKDIEVIKGIEFTTDKGHLLGLFLQEEIKSNDFYELVDRIRSQDGIPVVAHPYSFLRSNIKAATKEIRNKVCFESYNGRAFSFENARTRAVAEKYNIAQTAGSDAHFPMELGRGLSIVKDDLRKAIKSKKVIIQGRQTPNILWPTLSIFVRWYTQ